MKYPHFLAVILSVFCFSGLSAQTVSKVTAEQTGRKIIVYYQLDKAADITIQYSTDGGKTYRPMSHTSGDVGRAVEPGACSITWDVLADLETLVCSNLVFKVTPTAARPRPKKQFFTMLDYSWGSIRNTSSVGFRIGQTNLVGWYVAASVGVTGFHYGYDVEYMPLTVQDGSRGKLSLMGGMNVWLGCPLFFYAGAGYGYQSVTYQDATGVWHKGMKYRDYLGHAAVVEGGFQGNIKGFTMRLGYSLLIGEGLMHEASAGIGYTFKTK